MLGGQVKIAHRLEDYMREIINFKYKISPSFLKLKEVKRVTFRLILATPTAWDHVIQAFERAEFGDGLRKGVFRQ